ncbi:hypothetical protein HPB49_021039 [Dermacentor silvarum]|uniref:Uncharacterized protein n=1 Tax=Dermacentor silvarum TaxID=543639 RepID=A0ACB8CH59_DERSI|nr:hypothetical protein HPB49_021039 [Dermacentor silvarum]
MCAGAVASHSTVGLTLSSYSEQNSCPPPPSPDYAVRMKDELRARSQAEDESLQAYIPSFQELYDSADPSAPETEWVTRTIRRTHLRFQAYLRDLTFSSLDDLARAASDIQPATLAELTCQPPTSPEASLKPSCAWHGSSFGSRGTMVPSPSKGQWTLSVTTPLPPRSLFSLLSGNVQQPCEAAMAAARL